MKTYVRFVLLMARYVAQEYEMTQLRLHDDTFTVHLSFRYTSYSRKWLD